MFVFEFLLDSFINFAPINFVIDFVFTCLVLKLLNILIVIVVLLNLIVAVFFNFFPEIVDLVIVSFLVERLTLFFV